VKKKKESVMRKKKGVNNLESHERWKKGEEGGERILAKKRSLQEGLIPQEGAGQI